MHWTLLVIKNYYSMYLYTMCVHIHTHSYNNIAHIYVSSYLTVTIAKSMSSTIISQQHRSHTNQQQQREGLLSRILIVRPWRIAGLALHNIHTHTNTHTRKNCFKRINYGLGFHTVLKILYKKMVLQKWPYWKVNCFSYTKSRFH